MDGVVSQLDNKHCQLTEELWAEMARKCAVSGIYVSPYPHFSYQLATHYNVELLEPALRRFAASRTPFQVRASGLGIFTGAHPVLYIPIVRSRELAQFHEALWEEISSAASGIDEHYHPSHWIPHITLGIGDMNKENLSRIVHLLAERDLNWEITIDNIALIYDSIFTLFGTTMLTDLVWYPSLLKRLQVHLLNKI
jgi:2'-5' RNA ligase